MTKNQALKLKKGDKVVLTAAWLPDIAQNIVCEVVEPYSPCTSRVLPAPGLLLMVAGLVSRYLPEEIEKYDN